MKRHLRSCACIAALTLALAAGAFAKQPDVAAIRELQSRQAAAWNQHDAAAYSELFSVDGDVVNVLGWWWRGRAEIREKLTAAFAWVFRDSHLTITDVDVRFLDPSTAVAHVRWTMDGAKAPPGAPEPPREGIQVQILRKQGGGWLIESFQNTNSSPETPFPKAPDTAVHDHLTEVACLDVPVGETRPEFGCFNIGTVTGLQFNQPTVYWHLRTFESRKAADAARSSTGLVVEEAGQVWLSEFGPQESAPRGGKAIAVIGPLQLPSAKSYSAVLSYAVMRPGDSSRVHTHPGPEAWYVLAGEQCLETPAGANRSRAGGIMSVPPNVPMELNVTGTALRRAFALVIHDSTQQRGIPSDWKPSGACGLQ